MEQFRIAGKNKDYIKNIVTLSSRQFQKPAWIDFKFSNLNGSTYLYVETTDYHMDAILEISAPGFMLAAGETKRYRCSCDSISELLQYFRNEDEILCSFSEKEITASNQSGIANWKKPLLDDNGNYVRFDTNAAGFEHMIDSDIMKTLTRDLCTFSNFDSSLNASIQERTGYLQIEPERFNVYVLTPYLFLHHFKNQKSSIKEKLEISIMIEDASCVKEWHMVGVIKIKKSNTLAKKFLILNNQNFWFTLPDQYPGDQVIQSYTKPITAMAETSSQIIVDSKMFDDYAQNVMTGANYAIMDFYNNGNNKLNISAHKTGENGYLGQYVDLPVLNTEVVPRTRIGISSLYMQKIMAAKRICNNNFRFLVKTGTDNQNFGLCSDEMLLFMPPYAIKL